MSENSNKNQQYPFMYIVQPEITLPDSDMQEQLHVKIEASDQEVEAVEANGISDEIRIVSTESLKDSLENKVVEVNMSEVRVKEEEVVMQETPLPDEQMEAESIAEAEAEVEEQALTETVLEAQVIEDTDIKEMEVKEPEQELLGEDVSHDESILQTHDEVIVEMNTSVNVENSQKKAKMNKDTVNDSSKKVKKVIKKKYSDMTKEELIVHLAKIPPAVPKPLCNMIINGRKVSGEIQRRKGDMYFLKTNKTRKNEVIAFKMDEVEHIEVDTI